MKGRDIVGVRPIHGERKEKLLQSRDPGSCELALALKGQPWLGARPLMAISTSARLRELPQQTLISLPTTLSIASSSQWVVVEKSRMCEILLDLAVVADEFPAQVPQRSLVPRWWLVCPAGQLEGQHRNHGCLCDRYHSCCLQHQCRPRAPRPHARGRPILPQPIVSQTPTHALPDSPY